MLCYTAFSVPRWKSNVLAEILQSPRDTTLPHEGTGSSQTVEQRWWHSSESGDQRAPGAIPVTEVSIGAVVPSSLHMVQYLSMWDVWYPGVVGWPWLAAKLPLVLLLKRKGRENRKIRNEKAYVLKWGQADHFQFPPWAKQARLEENWINILPIIYVFN